MATGLNLLLLTSASRRVLMGIVDMTMSKVKEDQIGIVNSTDCKLTSSFGHGRIPADEDVRLRQTRQDDQLGEQDDRQV